VSRRTQQYRQFKRETVDDTFAAITHSHRTTKNVGRRCLDRDEDIPVILVSGRQIRYIPASLPIGEEKALRIAQTLHKQKH
jgi:hypothetical protein